MLHSPLKTVKNEAAIKLYEVFCGRDKFHQICEDLLPLIIERGDRCGQGEPILWSLGDIA